MAKETKNQKDNLIKSEVLPIGLGVAAYLAGRALPIIPKEISIFKCVDNAYLGGIIDGLGNVRNISAILMGTTALVLSHKILNDMNKPENIETLDESAESSNECRHVNALHRSGTDQSSLLVSR